MKRSSAGLDITIPRMIGLLIADELWKYWQIGLHRDVSALYQALFFVEGAHNVPEGRGQEYHDFL